MGIDGRNIRILALITDAFGGRGGIAQYNRDLLTALASLDVVRQIVVIPRHAPDPPVEIPLRILWDDRGIAGLRRWILAVLARMFSGRYDLVFCGHLHLLPIAWLTSRLRRTPLVLQIYGIEAWKPGGRLLARSLARRVDAVISISEITRDRFLQWSGYRGPVHILPNAIHLQRYGPGPEAPDLVQKLDLAGRTVLMTFGRMDQRERYKGFDEILEILPDLLSDVPNLVYLAAGEGPDRPRLEAKAADLGLTRHVRFPGYLPEDRKADYYRLADVYAMPSRGEGFGFVLLEALACGVPCIGSTTDGTREALRNGELGQLVDPDDREGLKQAILAALEHSHPPEGVDAFAFERFSERLERILARIVSGG